MRPDEESQGPVVHDRRRIDPATGKVRSFGEAPAQQAPAASGGPSRPGRHSVARPGGRGGEGVPGGAARGGEQPARTSTGTAPGGAPPGGAAPGERGPGGGQGPRADQDADREKAAAAAAEASARLAERTADLQRLQAEYANYRKRVERDRLAVREQALANVLNELVPVLDDIGRAREHGELVGGFKSVGDSLEATAAKLGLTSFGEAGDPFDPMLHEALMHSYSASVTEPTAVQILQPGYKVGERIIRPARVAVAEPGGDAEDSASAAAQADGDATNVSADGAGPDTADEAGASRAGEPAEDVDEPDAPDDSAG